eukprot:10371374-Alexandrium_andersonii.AAC.1
MIAATTLRHVTCRQDRSDIGSRAKRAMLPRCKEILLENDHPFIVKVGLQQRQLVDASLRQVHWVSQGSQT